MARLASNMQPIDERHSAASDTGATAAKEKSEAERYRLLHSSGEMTFADLVQAQAALREKPGARLFLCRSW